MRLAGQNRRRKAVPGWALFILLALSCNGGHGFLSSPARVLAAPRKAEDPDAVCRDCHQQIYDQYQRTPMARASGKALDGLLPGAFLHQDSGIEYRLFARDGSAWLSYDRPDASPEKALHGEQKLSYYIGSGNRGRTYLFERDGFWFESPVNWYSKKQLWDMNPKSLKTREMPFTLKVDAGCLHCHASGVSASLPGSRNHFGEVPFLHGGITCESCHGDPTTHLSRRGHGPILNPASLPVSRKVSICLQCHLEGEIAVDELGRSLHMFKPGDDLSQDVRFFVHEGEIGSMGRATSQWEALLQSACFRGSAGKLTCTACHDPHDTPAPAERAAYYRNKCIACHSESTFVARHHPEEQDCTRCHMAREKAQDIAHEQVTDHFIQKRPNQQPTVTTAQRETLVAIGGEPASPRDLGLAYAQMAARGDIDAGRQAQRLLQQAERDELSAATPVQDSDLHTELGFLDLAGGDRSAARQELRSALTADSLNTVAAGNLAVLLAQAHELDEAVKLWRIVATNNPGETIAGVNLAMAACMMGDSHAAMEALLRVIRFSPDDTRARSLLAQLTSATEPCSPR
jgi:predicted CXXCH cytochrome family protein